MVKLYHLSMNDAHLSHLVLRHELPFASSSPFTLPSESKLTIYVLLMSCKGAHRGERQVKGLKKLN